MAKVSGGGLYQYLQSVQGYLAPPITAVFFLGLFWKRINSAGATWGLAGGFVLGMIKLTIQAFYGKGKIENPGPPGADRRLQLPLRHRRSVCRQRPDHRRGLAADPAAAAGENQGLTYGSIHHGSGRGNPQELGCWATNSWSASSSLLVLGMYLYFSFWLK